MKHIQFTGKPAAPNLDQMSPNDRERLRSPIRLAGNARSHMGDDNAEIRKTFDRISMLHRLAASNQPVRPDGKVLGIDTSVQDKLVEKKAGENQPNHEAVQGQPDEADDAITYWGDYIFSQIGDNND